MPYCSYCAAAIDQSQVFCPRCGRPVPVAPSPAAAGSDARPWSVSIAVMLLALCWVVGMLVIAVSMAMYPARAGVPVPVPILFLTAVLSLLWITCMICLWQRQGWARFVVVALILWNLGSLALTLTRLSGTNLVMWTFATPAMEAIVRIVAAAMLLQPQSNAWFKK